MSSLTVTAVTTPSASATTSTPARVSIQTYKEQHKQHRYKLPRTATEVNTDTLIEVMMSLKIPRADIAKRLVTLHVRTDIKEAEKLLDPYYKILEILGPKTFN